MSPRADFLGADKLFNIIPSQSRKKLAKSNQLYQSPR